MIDAVAEGAYVVAWLASHGRRAGCEPEIWPTRAQAEAECERLNRAYGGRPEHWVEPLSPTWRADRRG